MDAATLANVLEGLEQGKPANGFHLHHGRIDLRHADLAGLGVKRHFGEEPPFPSRAREALGRFAEVVEPCAVPLTLGGIELRDIDFSNSQLDGIRLFNCTIENCVFDNASCKGWRMWATSVSDSSFSSASLRGGALGGLLNGKQNRFEDVKFIRTDLRGTTYKSAVFVGCTFDGADLLKIDFGGSRFVRCTFRGELREVEFYDQVVGGGGSLSPNMMEDVDFSGASLRHVLFRRLNLDRVRFPIDGEHLVLPNYPSALDYALERLTEDDVASRMIRAYLSDCKRWVGPQQRVGVFNRLDFVGLFGEDNGARLEGLLRDAPPRQGPK